MLAIVDATARCIAWAVFTHIGFPIPENRFERQGINIGYPIRFSDEHVSTFSLDDAPPERFAHLDHLDSGERAEERCRDNGRDRNDDARMVEAVPGFRLSALGPDDPGGAPQEAR